MCALINCTSFKIELHLIALHFKLNYSINAAEATTQSIFNEYISYPKM